MARKCITCTDYDKCNQGRWSMRGTHKNCYKPIDLYEAKCNNCGKKQEPMAEDHKGMMFYACGVKCECGGEFVLWVKGKPIKPFQPERGDE